MAVRTILRMGAPSLFQPSTQLASGAFGTPELLALITDLKDTMAAANGAGIAAPQIGVNQQVVIFGSRPDSAPNPRYPDRPVIPFTVLINPTLTPIGQAQEVGWEGCLSVPGLRGAVPRYTKLNYSGFDEFGSPITREVVGWHARVVQHECDHLWGILYPQRIRDMTQFGFTEVLFPELDASSDDD